MDAKPEREHRWLQKLVGEWTSRVETATESGEAQMRTGSTSVRALGGLWIVVEGDGTMGGRPSTNMMSLGYNPKTKKFVGVFISSVVAFLWPYEGELDASGRSLHLDFEGPDTTGNTEGSVSYRDVVEVVDDEHWVLRAYAKGEDGSWSELKRTDYQRVK
jgi:hypothetical protein